MNMYIGDYWAPFPSSEYGGMWVVMAENVDQCIDLLEDLSYDEEYTHLIPEAVSKAKVFTLDTNTSYKPQVVESFFT